MITLSSHEEIRDWVSARAGKPAIYEPPGGEPVLRIVFGQSGDHENDDDSAVETLSLVEWKDWFALLEEKGLELQVPDDQPGVRDETHHFVRK